jgi:hypothetical protein
MIDYFNLANNDKNFQIFYGIGSGVWQTWQKPRGCTMIQIFTIGGGAGGSSGQTASTGTRLGGGGGGGSAIVSGSFLANLLPDTLFILVGMGGLGQTISSNGTSGQLSYVSSQPTTASTANLVLINGAIPPTCTNGQTLGVGGTVFSQTSALLSYLGMITAVAGPNAAQGGTNSGPGDSVALATNIVTGGAGGGSVRALGNQPFAGGGLQGSGFVPTIAGSQNGEDGISMPYYNLPSNQTMTNAMVFVGGLGGGSSHISNGGKGGNGSYGCGGGGGGGSILGGSGGNGGDGLVIITCW